jgi:lipopolysaccharide transport system ATP-binding protein
MPPPVITVSRLGKCFHIYDRPRDRLKQALCLGRKRYYREFWALKDVSLEVEKGQAVGIMGRNGSGKSTLLQIVTGTMVPTTGGVQVAGRVASLLELGAGFIPEFTGRENVYLYGTIIGLTRKEIDERFDRIAAFADIGDFIDQPVRIYSSGMYVRLAFSAAINVDPDVLIVDEALAVGDARFQHRCMTRIQQFREAGVTILLVSHDTEAVKRVCDRAIVLDRGRIVNQGPAPHMANWYLAFMTNDFDLDKTAAMERAADQATVGATVAPVVGEAPAPEEPEDMPPPDPAAEQEAQKAFRFFRHGDGNARIVSAALCDSRGRKVEHVHIGRKVHFRMEVEFHAAVESHGVGLYVKDTLGTNVIGINTFQQRVTPPPAAAGDRLVYTISFLVDLKPGYYSISPSVAYRQDQMQWLDYVDNMLVFRVTDPDPRRIIFGLYHPREIQVSVDRSRDARAVRKS